MALKPRSTKGGARPAKSNLMSLQDTKSRGDSTASRDARITISTTEDIKERIDKAHHRLGMNRTQFIEEAILEKLESLEDEN
jgi:hypothetical protein